MYLFNVSAHKQKKEGLVSLYRLVLVVLTQRSGMALVSSRQTASSLPLLCGSIILCNAKMGTGRGLA